MKNKISIFIILVLAITIGFASCEKRETDVPELAKVDSSKILKVSDIYRIYKDSGNNYTFTQDYMLYGTITMDDSDGNIYKEAYIQDETGGVNIYKLAYQGETTEGNRVRMNLNGAQIIYYSGKMELSFVNVKETSERIIIQQENVPIEPEVVTMSQILDTPAYYDCRLIKLTDVQFKDTTLTYATLNGSSAQSRYLEDCANSSSNFVARNSDYSSYAGDSLPKGKGSIIGIMTRYIKTSSTGGTTTTYQIIIRSKDEVDMEGPRCGAE